MIALPSPDALLAGPLGGWLEQQARVREEAKKRAANRLYLAALIGLPLFAFAWIAFPGAEQVKLTVALFGGLGVFAWSQGPKNKAKKQVKIGINRAIAQALGLDYRDEVEPGEAFVRCKTFDLVPHFDRSRFEDEWSGMLGGRRFRLFEAHLEERRGSGKNRRWVTVFRGAVMSIGFARPFHGTTLVQRAGRHRRLLGGKKDSIDFEGQRLDCVDLVNPQFEDAFDVWSDDQVEARYLVNPAYVERMVALEIAFRGQDIQTLFVAGDLVVALKTGKLFESGSIDPSEDRDKLAATIEQFGRLADLADALDEKPRGFGARSAEPEAEATAEPPAARPVFGRKGLT